MFRHSFRVIFCISSAAFFTAGKHWRRMAPVGNKVTLLYSEMRFIADEATQHHGQ
jgi:hypothetical protein